jgi:FkbM family methyltransferase
MKRIFLSLITFLFSRTTCIRLSKALSDNVLGNNNDNRKTNGEFNLLNQIFLSLKKENINHEIVMFDIGANIGYYTLNLLNYAQKYSFTENIKVYCFEPSSFTFSELKTNLMKHPLARNVHFANLAMSDSNGKSILHIANNGAEVNSFYKRRTEGLGIHYNNNEQVITTTLDTYCIENNIFHINFIKIDVEGHELAVIKGAANMLKQQAIDYIQFEYGGCWIDSRTLLLDMYDLIISFGYSIGKIFPNGIEFYSRYDQRLETYQMANFLACKPNLVDNFARIKPWVESK